MLEKLNTVCTPCKGVWKVKVSASLRLSDQRPDIFKEKEIRRGSDKQRHRPGGGGTMETMPKTKSLQLLIDGSLKSFRRSFGDGHLDFVTDKKGQTRGTWGFWIFKGDLWDSAKCKKEWLGEGDREGPKGDQTERGIKGVNGVQSTLAWLRPVPNHPFFFNPFVTISLCTLTLHTAHVGAARSKCQLLGEPAWVRRARDSALVAGVGLWVTACVPRTDC